MDQRLGTLAGLGVNEGRVDPGFWRGRRVLMTGHTGFKGSWLSLWLQSLGAEVTGVSRGVPTDPCLHTLARVAGGMKSEVAVDIRDFELLAQTVAAAAPEVVIHMAAQPLVRRSFEDPRETYETNVMGTVNLLESVRRASGVRVVINVTTDKCYENREWEWGYRENEPMGGFDPYSSSKGCSELVTAAYRSSFFSEPEGPLVATARAGNVIGGGDWGRDRLFPDLMRAALAGEPLSVRNPNAVRPWQHVLNPLSGYLLLAQALWQEPQYAGGWNFGPPDEDARPVRWIVETIRERWPSGLEWEHDGGAHPHEADYLKLDSSRARQRLGWRPAVDLLGALGLTVDWYRALDGGGDMRAVTLEQIDAFSKP